MAQIDDETSYSYYSLVFIGIKFFFCVCSIETDRWVMMGLIGFAVGLLGFLLHQFLERIASLKWSTTKEFLDVSLQHTILLDL